jgi:hypothetical protein
VGVKGKVLRLNSEDIRNKVASIIGEIGREWVDQYHGMRSL